MLFLRHDGSFDYYFITNLLPSLLLKNFKNWSTFDKVMVKKVDCLKCPVCCGTDQLKDKLTGYLTRTVVTVSY